MKRVVGILVTVCVTGLVAYGDDSNIVNTQVQSNPTQNQSVQAIGGGNSIADSSSIAWADGGDADSFSYSEASDSSAVLYYAPTSISNYKAKTQPLTTYSPYLPVWQHGGWGTIKAYFPNGPTSFDKVYERTFDPTNEVDMDEVKGILKSLPYSGALEMVGGFINSVATLFGGPPKYHHGRGFEIANAVVRDRRPDGKPLLVFIDSYVDPTLLAEEGYAYVGEISLEGSYKRNWDHVYNAAVAEALPWDVDILLISGGMKGVSVGTTASTSGTGGYSQTSYSLSLLPGVSKGITEGKGEAILSASAYRYCPQRIHERQIPESLYERIRRRPQTASTQAAANPTATAPRTATANRIVAGDKEKHVAAPTADDEEAGIRVSPEVMNRVFPEGQTVNNVVVR